MRKILIDESLRTKLNGLTEIVELCDESGQIVATVIPKPAAFNPDE